MSIKGAGSLLKRHRRLLGWGLATLIALSWLLLYKLGSLTGGLSRGEIATAVAPLGWHNIYIQPFDLPLKLIRSVVFFAYPDHGQTLTRLPNVFFGAMTIAAFGVLIRIWHGTRTAVLGTMLFATSAWVLHVSRLASTDVLYLWAMTTFLLSHFLLRRFSGHLAAWYLSIIVWGILLYIPGMVWMVVLDIWLQRRQVAEGWRQAGRWWQKSFYVIAGLIWLPLLIVNLLRPDNLLTWLGVPHYAASAGTVAKQFVAVPVHLFIRGPEYPQLWLGKAPLLDVFTLVACGLGIYFYATHRKAARSRHLALFFLIGLLLVGLNGPVSLSLLVPMLYLAAATGLAYLLYDWLKIFPSNPLARGLGIGLVVFAVALSCLYNYRAYFIAWPHAPATKAAFESRR